MTDLEYTVDRLLAAWKKGNDHDIAVAINLLFTLRRPGKADRIVQHKCPGCGLSDVEIAGKVCLDCQYPLGAA